jgi:modification methylase
MGSGTTALASIKLDRKFIGIDISPEYCELATKRIKIEGNIELGKLSL